MAVVFASLSLLAGPAQAQEAAQDGMIAGLVANTLGPFGNWLASWVFATVNIGGVDLELIVLWLALPMLIFTVYMGFVNFKPSAFKHAWKIVRGDYRDDSAPGEVSQFQALTTALSGTVGLGNIGGVAIAIAMGGPGATFWMIIIGLMAMSLKFVECTLGVKYREVHADGTVSGGPMYYLKNGLAKRGLVKLGIVLSAAYAFFAVFSLLQFIQVNQAYSQFSSVTGFDNGFAFGLTLAVLVAVIIFGGIATIGRVTEKLVPIMGGLYIVAALVIIGVHISDVPTALITIFADAFSTDSIAGGIIGSFVVGMQRAVYSTEAGLGSATIAHAAAKTREPISQGMLALMEPFIDVVIIATLTALVIVVTGTYTDPTLNDIQMTSAAFGSVISWFPWVLAIAVLLFAFSTVVSWGYYVEKVWTYIFPDTHLSRRIFRLLFCVMLIPPSMMSVDQVVGFMDSIFFLMAVPNVLGLYFLAPEIKADLANYMARVKSGELAEVKH